MHQSCHSMPVGVFTGTDIWIVLFFLLVFFSRWSLHSCFKNESKQTFLFPFSTVPQTRAPSSQRRHALNVSPRKMIPQSMILFYRADCPQESMELFELVIVFRSVGTGVENHRQISALLSQVSAVFSVFFLEKHTHAVWTCEETPQRVT